MFRTNGLTVSVCVAVLTFGCTGTVKVKSLLPADVTVSNGELKGIVFYPPALFYEESELTTRVDAKGNVIAWATEPPGATKCHGLKVEKLVTRPDYLHPKLLYYEHGILEAYTFGMELTADGMLKSVNTQSTPDRGQTLANLASAAGSVAPIAAAPTGPPAFPLCNDGPVVRGYRRYDLNFLK